MGKYNMYSLFFYYPSKNKFRKKEEKSKLDGSINQTNWIYSIYYYIIYLHTKSIMWTLIITKYIGNR